VAVTVVAITLLTGLTFGLAAATQVRFGRLASTLREDGYRSTGGRYGGAGRRTLVAAEVALSLMLIIGAALLTVSFVRLQQVAPGFTPANVLTADISLPVPGAFDPERDGRRWSLFFRELQDGLSRSAGVDAAGAVSVLPLTDAVEMGSTATIGEPPPIPGKAHQSEYLVIEGDYFRAMRIPLLGGRTFLATDVPESPPVAIVNREYARRYLGDPEQALAHSIRTYFDFSHGRAARTIVGVVDNVQNGALNAAPQPQVYVPEQQMPYPGLQIVVRTGGDPVPLMAVLKREVKRIDPRIAVSRARPLQRVFDDSLARQRFNMTLIGFFAGAALVLAMIGLYGVISLSVSNRRREIGVRMALGARTSDVFRLVLREGLGIAAAGVVIGLLGAFAASRLVAALLYGVSATNASVYLTAAVVTVVVTIGATLIPARRATRVDPTVALHGD
jgi:predicted permease